MNMTTERLAQDIRAFLDTCPEDFQLWRIREGIDKIILIPADPQAEAERLLRLVCEHVCGTPIAEQSCELADISLAIESAFFEKSPPAPQAEPPQAVSALQEQLAAARAKLETIVCVKAPDDGVVLLSNDGPCHPDPVSGIATYDHVHFSPLGDALIELWNLLLPKGDRECPPQS